MHRGAGDRRGEPELAPGGDDRSFSVTTTAVGTSTSPIHGAELKSPKAFMARGIAHGLIVAISARPQAVTSSRTKGWGSGSAADLVLTRTAAYSRRLRVARFMNGK